MIFKNLESYISGYLRISTEGYYIERFINICRKENIPVWNIKKEKDIRLTFSIKIKDFKKICKIAKTTKCKLKIKKKKGFPFILNRYRKRKIFAIFLIIVIILIGMSSNYVWNIEVIEENGNNLENIMQNLNQSGLVVGKRKAEINTKEVINKVRLERNDIAWMGIELKGTNAIVKVVKSDEKPDIIDENEYCSIVADKAGIITKISAQDGTANVKVGDTINEGETLINGWVEGKYTGIRYVHAKGEIQAKVWHTKHKFIEYNTTEKRETGNQEEKYAIKFNNFKINLGKRVSNFEIYDTIETENKFKIFSDFYLPISIVKTTNKEIENVQKKYNKEEAKMLGIKELEEELNNEIENKDNIVNKNINTYENENGLDVYVTYEVLENIGTNEKIVF